MFQKYLLTENQNYFLTLIEFQNHVLTHRGAPTIVRDFSTGSAAVAAGHQNLLTPGVRGAGRLGETRVGEGWSRVFEPQTGARLRETHPGVCFYSSNEKVELKFDPFRNPGHDTYRYSDISSFPPLGPQPTWAPT